MNKDKRELRMKEMTIIMQNAYRRVNWLNARS